MITFHKILAGCEAGDQDAWRSFLAEYTPIVYQLAGVSFVWGPEKRQEFWREALKTLSAGNGERLRAFSHHSEREFLVDLRATLLELAIHQVDPSQDAKHPPGPTLDTLGAILKGLPLVHQEMVFLALAGYSQATLEKMLGITPSVAQSGFERLGADYAPLLERSEDRCLWPAAWLEITRAARAAKSQDCTPLRPLIRILDGQASWNDRLRLKSTAVCVSIAWNFGRRCSRLLVGSARRSPGRCRRLNLCSAPCRSRQRNRERGRFWGGCFKGSDIRRVTSDK